ncbi:MAG TPA: molybdopterin-dependent oxidoreductase [Planctomycetaceae bacterium]
MSAGVPRYRPETDPFYQSAEPPRAGSAPPDAVVSPDAARPDRIPPGQVRTKKWPVLHAGRVPVVTPEQWSLTIGGLVERPVRLTWPEFAALPRVRVFSDFHCVTRWSRLGNLWEGVATAELARRVGVRPEARFVIVGGFDDGWTTNLPLADFLAGDALLADRHDGRPLTADHGGPVRLVVPRLYAWKSAKWVKSVTFVRDDEPGYWERLGYHDRGDPWAEERFR